MRQADTTREPPGGNRGIAIALMRRPPADAACDSCRSVSGTTCPLVSTRGLHGQETRVTQTPPQEAPGGNRGIAHALVRRLRADAASALLRGGSLLPQRQ